MRTVREGADGPLSRSLTPGTEESMLYCQRCAERAALGYLFKRQTPPVRRVHADDAAQAFVAVMG